jgi:TolA-binding protein
LQQYEQAEYMAAATNFTAVMDQDVEPDLHPAALFNLAMAQQLMGDAPSALQSYQQYQKDYPNDERSVEVRLQIGSLQESSRDWEAAAKSYEDVLADGLPDERVAEVLFRLGQCRENELDVDGALAAYERAMSEGAARDPFRLSAVARGAAIYEDREDYPNALAAYRELIENADDAELVAVAQMRADELEAVIR